jgi:Subtilase family
VWERNLGGNGGSNDDSTPSYPSNYNVANVIAVAAINKSRRLASWSNYGATTVDLGAPAVGVWSTTASLTGKTVPGGPA